MFRNALSSFFEGTEDIIPSTTQLSRGLIGIQPNLAVAGVMSHAHSFFLCLWALAVALALCHVGSWNRCLRIPLTPGVGVCSS
jgi:hypothetical protein